MRAYPKWNAVRSELTCTLYRALLRVGDDSARNWYMGSFWTEVWT